MKLTFRTIKGTTFNLDAEPTTSVGDLKAALEAAQGPSMPKDLVKLVYKGKVLEDNSKAISEYSVDESGFLVVFVQKAPAAKPAAATGNTSSAPPAAAEVGVLVGGASTYCMQSCMCRTVRDHLRSRLGAACTASGGCMHSVDGQGGVI